MNISITIDVEQDCPPFMSSYRGIEEGLPEILEVFDDESVKGTFFVTGEIAKRFSSKVKEIRSMGHEIGCHGYSHRRFDKISEEEAWSELKISTEILREHYPVISFRAPCLKFPQKYNKYLTEFGYKINSTSAKHKNPFIRINKDSDIYNIPVTTTSLLLRAPSFFRNIFLKRFKDPIVLFFHPWELVDLRKEDLRFDCRYNTGEKTSRALRDIIKFYKNRGADFKKINEFTEVRR